MGLTEFYGFYRFLLGFSRFYLQPSKIRKKKQRKNGKTRFFSERGGFTGFYWVLVGFTEFSWVLLGLTSIRVKSAKKSNEKR